MRSPIRTVLSVAVIFLLGYATASWLAPASTAQETKPAYLIMSAHFLEPDKLGPYREIAVPQAQKAGATPLARGTSEATFRLLEGEWPFDGQVVLQKYDSMDALLNTFYYSPEYQEAIKLREGYFKADFIIAVEGVD